MGAMASLWGRVWVAAVLVAGPAALGQPAPSFKCESKGTVFLCIPQNVEVFELVPEWTLHTSAKPKSSFGHTYRQKRAPKEWTILEMTVRLNDQPDAPQKVWVYTLYVWVKQCKHNKVVFAPVVNPWREILSVVKQTPPTGECTHDVPRG